MGEIRCWILTLHTSLDDFCIVGKKTRVEWVKKGWKMVIFFSTMHVVGYARQVVVQWGAENEVHNWQVNGLISISCRGITLWFHFQFPKKASGNCTHTHKRPYLLMGLVIADLEWKSSILKYNDMVQPTDYGDTSLSLFLLLTACHTKGQFFHNVVYTKENSIISGVRIFPDFLLPPPNSFYHNHSSSSVRPAQRCIYRNPFTFFLD